MRVETRSEHERAGHVSADWNRRVTSLPFNTALPFEWFILLLRILFIFLLYFFLFQLMRTIARELRVVALSTAGAGPLAVEDRGTSGARLVVEPGADVGYAAGTAFLLRNDALIGRHPGSSIVLADTYISGEHARLTFHDGRWWVADLGSTNGTFVNGARVERPTPLNDGDEIRFGRVPLRFVA